MKLAALPTTSSLHAPTSKQLHVRMHVCAHAFSSNRQQRHTHASHQHAAPTSLPCWRHKTQHGRAGCRPPAAAAAAAAAELALPSRLQLLLVVLGQAAAATCGCLSTAVRRLAAGPTAVVTALMGGSDSAAAAQQHATGMLRQLRMLALVVPFAQVTGGSFQANVWMPFWQALFGFTHFYLFILFMRVLLSWFPALDWSRNPWLVIKVITDPYLNVFRNLIPALFMAIDLTPLLGFMLLQDFVAILENCVVENLFSDTIDEPTSDPFIYMPQDYSRFTPTKPA